MGRGDCYMEMANFESAIADYNEVIRLLPHMAEGFAKRGNARLHKGMGGGILPKGSKDDSVKPESVDKAIADFTEALRIDPNDLGSRSNRAMVYELKGDYDKAIVDENRVLRDNPGYARGYHLRGQTYEKKGDHDKAILDENIAIRLDPSNAGPYYALRALAYEKKGDKAKAAADREMVERLGPISVDVSGSIPPPPAMP